MNTRRFSYALSLFALLSLLALTALSPGPATQASTRQAVIDVPFFSQTALRDQRISTGGPLTLGNDPTVPLWEYGCGVASLAMVYRRYGVDTDVVRLNEALRQAGGFSGALLAWDRTDAFRQAGRPWIQGIERINTAWPQDYRSRVDDELAAGHPVLAYLGNRHYVVLVGKDDQGVYRINDPWKLTPDEGQGVALEQNDLKLKFDDIRQFVFIYPDRNAPTNGVPVSGALADKYYSLGGSRGSLGDPVGPAGATTDGGQFQLFARGALLAVNGGVYALYGPVWEKYLAEGLSRRTTTTADTERPQLSPTGRVALGWPVADLYSYFVGRAVEQRADFAQGSIVWTEGDRPQNARILTAANAVRAEYFANPDLAGKPAYTRFEETLLFDWREGRPGPWVEPDGFSARYTATVQVGFPLGWWYNFVVDADEGVRVKLDGETVLDAWRGEAKVHKFTRRLGGGAHTLVVEYREGSGPARLLVNWRAALMPLVFAAEETGGPFERLPASVAESAPDLATPVARATATARAVLATMTAEARITPTPDTAVATAAEQAFEAWAQGQGEPYRDVQITVEENDGYFAQVRAIAWFRPARVAPWEEREAVVECRQVGGTWQCDEQFEFRLTAGEQARRIQATATAVAAARATAIANLPTALRQMTERFGLEFVYVPAGEFLMGSTATEVEAAFELCQEVYGDCQRRWFEAEQAQHQVDLSAFWIGKTEVTDAQYRPFIEAGGYMDRELWTEAGWAWREEEDVTQPRCWDDEEWNQPHHPVVCLSWYEAAAYARWLSRETGLDVRLPSEAQWEKAARGTDGRMWPWGDEPPDGTRLNYCDRNCTFGWKDEAVDDGYGGTAPAGSYPAGASPYGALDMAGNVGEWTSTLWGGCDWPPGFAYPYRADDGREEIEGGGCRVVRGGSWLDHRVFARAAFRYRVIPGDWDGNVGVRVVVVPR